MCFNRCKCLNSCTRRQPDGWHPHPKQQLSRFSRSTKNLALGRHQKGVQYVPGSLQVRLKLSDVSQQNSDPTSALTEIWVLRHTRQRMTSKSSPGPSLAPHVGVPGPSTNFAVPPVARVPGVTRPVSMIRARPRPCRLLLLTAQCEQDRDQ